MAPQQTALRQVLTTPKLIAFGLAYINLMGVFTLYGLATEMTAGMMALAFVLATVAMGLTALSYAAMAGEFVAAGSVYSYVSKTIAPGPAFLVGWVVMLDYLILPLLNFLLIGLYMHELIPAIPQWAYSLVALVVIAGLAIKGVNESATVGFVTMLAGCVFIVVFAGYLIASIVDAGGVGSIFDVAGFATTAALESPDAGVGSVFGAAAILCLMFLGFDGITTFSEETRDPRRQVGRAIIFTCAISGVVFIFISYLMALAWPDAWREMENPDVAASELMLLVANPTINVAFTVIFVVGCIGSGLSALSAGSRIVYSMGRDGVLPRPFARLHPRYKTPIVAITLIALLGILALFTDLMSIASIVNFGALVAFIAVNLCVFFHFWLSRGERGVTAAIRYLVLPLAGVVINVAIWLSLDGTAKTIGAIWTALGLIMLVAITRGFTRPVRELGQV